MEREVLVRAAAIFGITIAESKKYAPKNNMKLPKTTG